MGTVPAPALTHSIHRDVAKDLEDPLGSGTLCTAGRDPKTFPRASPSLPISLPWGQTLQRGEEPPESVGK